MADNIGHALSSGQVEILQRFHDWLADEGVAAGGIGPGETGRIHERHIADSLLFARFFEPPETLWDLGSGIGLPGIPLAVLLSGTECVLIDRSGRRVSLMRRAVRVLGLENVVVRQDEITRLGGTVPVIVTRATLPPDQLKPQVERLLEPGGVAVAGGSWVAAPEQPGWVTEEGAQGSLDRPVWFLIMRRQ